MRLALLGLALAGCAVAGSPAHPPDARPGSRDGSLPPLDAPPLPVDGPLQGGCASGSTCATAMALGSVSGDTGQATVQGSGFQSAWFSVRVTEDDSGVFATPMNLTVQLTSPANTNYDLFVYVNEGSDVVECTTPTTSSTNTGTADQAHVTWGETGTFANGNDDSRTVSIEVRPISGQCSAGSTYQLVVTGDL